METYRVAKKGSPQIHFIQANSFEKVVTKTGKQLGNGIYIWILWAINGKLTSDAKEFITTGNAPHDIGEIVGA